MSDDQNLEAQLAAFGQTLESETGEPIRSGSTLAPSVSGRVPRRWWAIGGAAAAGVLAIVGLAALAGRGEDADVAAPAATPVATGPTATQPGPTTTATATTTTMVPADALEPVPADPLGLEVAGWTLESRTSGPFEFPVDDVPCDAAAVLADFDGVDEVHDILIAPAGGLDVDVQVLDVGSLDAGNRLAAGMQAVGDCIGELGGGGVEVGAMSSIRATWFRAGSDFAMATIVGEAGRSIILEIENAPFDDELIADLIQRSAAYLGTPATTAAADTTTSLLPPESAEAPISIPDDPLGLEADGWVLADRSESAYRLDAERSDFECPEIDGRTEFDGVPLTADLIEPPDGSAGAGLDSMRITVLELGDRTRAEAFAALVEESAQCWAAFLPEIDPGTDEVTVGGVPELGATWYRVGILVFVVVVGDDGTVVRLDPFGEDDDMLAVSDDFLTDLVERAARFVDER